MEKRHGTFFILKMVLSMFFHFPLHVPQFLLTTLLGIPSSSCSSSVWFSCLLGLSQSQTAERERIAGNQRPMAVACFNKTSLESVLPTNQSENYLFTSLTLDG